MKLITDVHNHSEYSHDCNVPLVEMVESALDKGVAFYGTSEHFDYDITIVCEDLSQSIDEERYFHDARHVQEDYAGVINVLVGAELSYCDDPRVIQANARICEKYAPDFIVNSVHTYKGHDYYHKNVFYQTQNGEKVLREKKQVYKEYLQYIQDSLNVPYPYDIVGHIGYAARYAPYENREITLAEFRDEIDAILKTIIQKDKILEVNGKSKGMQDAFLPSKEIIQRYYELGGRKVSYGADAHLIEQQLASREKVVQTLKEIGFTYLTVPCKGEHIKVEI